MLLACFGLAEEDGVDWVRAFDFAQDQDGAPGGRAESAVIPHLYEMWGTHVWGEVRES